MKMTQNYSIMCYTATVQQYMTYPLPAESGGVSCNSSRHQLPDPVDQCCCVCGCCPKVYFPSTALSVTF